MNDKTRLTLDDTVIVAILKLAGGNPGALRVCAEIMKRGMEIDPKDMGGFGALMSMDSLGIYGSRIWLLYEDVCRENLVKTIACLRGWQLGILPERDLQAAIDGDRARVDTNMVLSMVKAQLKDFGGPEHTQETPIPTPPRSSIPEIERVIDME